MEHKYLMWKRIEYITQLNQCDLSKWMREYESIYEKTQLIHNIGIKYNISDNRSSLNSIVTLMNEISEYENKNIKKIIMQLKLLQEKLLEDQK